LDDISTSYSSVVRATYELVAKNKLDYSSYIVTSKTPADGNMIGSRSFSFK
jgi:hypothetical protein